MKGRLHVPPGPVEGVDRHPGLQRTSEARWASERAHVGWAVVVAAAYFASARLGLSFAFAHASISAIWPPTGIALAAVFLGGYEMLPAVAVGALLANLTTPAPLGAVIGITIGNTLEALVGAALLRRVRLDSSLGRMRDVLAIVVLAGILSTAISATFGVVSLAAFGGLQGSELPSAWRTWWLGDMGGVMLVTTAVLVFARTPLRWWRSWDAARTLLLVLLLTGISVLVLRYDSGFPYLVFPPLIVVALVCRQRGAVLGGLVVSGIAVWLTVHGKGPFMGGGRDSELIRAQVFVGVGAITALLVAVARSEREVAEEALGQLAHKERVLQDAQRLAQIGSFEYDVRSGQVVWSDQLYRILGLDPGRHPAGYESLRDLLHDEDRSIVDEVFRRSCREWTPHESVHRIVRPDGQVRTLECHTRVERDADGAPFRMVGTALDVTALSLAEERFRALFETAPYARVVIDVDGKIVLANSTSEQLFGYGRGELIGAPVEKLIPMSGDGARPWYSDATTGAVVDGSPAELRARRGDGREFLLEASLTPLRTEQGMLVSVALTDITERKLAAEALAYRASHDPLTGLPNRTLFLDRLEHALGRARRSKCKLAVMFLDLDDFKSVNDTRGHDVGDLLLVGLTPKLSSALRPGDTIARFGGDEFVVLCEDLSDPTDALAIADRIAHACSGGVVIGDDEHAVTVSIGVVLVSDPEIVTPSDVLRDADAAMYRAKAIGKGRIELFDDGMRARLVERIAIEASLRRAIDCSELRVFFQPIVALEQGRVVGAEALLRWQHPHRGLLGPAEFLHVAESSGLIVPIGEWVIGQACRQAARWREQLGPAADPIRMSVNVSARELRRPELAGWVEHALRETRLDPSLLELEVTEAILFDDLDSSTRALRELKALGARVVLDDFGTGYSSLGYVKRLPIDAVKIDRTLLRDLDRDEEARSIVRAVVGMAAALGVGVCAEGIETAAQLEQLRAMGCRIGQGYLFARPAAADEVWALLEAGARPAVPA